MKLQILGVILLTSLLSACGFEQVDEGYRGIKTEWGKVVGDPLTPGLYFYNPVSSSVFEMDVRERKLEGKTECFTIDTQTVSVTYAITYYPEHAQIGKLYSQFGREWDQTIVVQTVLGAVKDVVGRYKADDLVGKREDAKKAAETHVKEALASRNVHVTRLDFTNLDFNDQYEHAVEAKVVAVQKAAEAKNKTVEVEEQAKQTLTTAKANAEAMRIKSNALSQNKSLVEYEAVQRWNGELPQFMFGSGTMPMLNLDSLVKGKK